MATERTVKKAFKGRELTAEERTEKLQKVLDDELACVLYLCRRMPFKEGQEMLQARLKTLKEAQEIIHKNSNQFPVKEENGIMSFLKKVFPGFFHLISWLISKF